MSENFGNHRRVFNHDNDFQGAATAGAMFPVDISSRQDAFVILSDTFYELVHAVIQRLEHPYMLARNLIVGSQGRIVDFRLRGNDAKSDAARAFQGLGYFVLVVSHSLNDLGMLRATDRGLLV